MDKLYSWTAKRAGAGITITHSCGRITGVASIAPENICERFDPLILDRRSLVATHNNGTKYELHL